MTPRPEDRRLLHFTHVRHLPTIVGSGLLADTTVDRLLTHEIGDREIKSMRRSLPVTRPPGGHPCDYVPFYFAPRSPMLYKIAIGGVQHYQDGQDPLVYLVTTVGDVCAAGLRWVFSDGNCGARLTRYHDDLGELDTAVDWPLQEAARWNSTADDPNRATRRAAEFLVHRAAPWRLVRMVVVRNAATAAIVMATIERAEHRPTVVVRPGWYYTGDKFR